RCFTVDEDAVILWDRKYQAESARKSADDHPDPCQCVAGLVEQAPAVRWEKGSEAEGMALIAQQVEVLLKPKPLRWGLAGGIGNKEEYFHEAGTRSLLPEFVKLKMTFR